MDNASIPASTLMCMLVESLGIAKTMDLLADEARNAAIRCGTSDRWQGAARKYLNASAAIKTARNTIYPVESSDA